MANSDRAFNPIDTTPSQLTRKGEPESTLWWLTPRTAKLLTPVLLLFGLECWLIVGRGLYGNWDKLLLLLIALIEGFIPPLRDAIDWLWRRLERPAALVNLCLVPALSIGSSLFLYATLHHEKIPFHPTFQDEFSYLIQMHMLARGRLWMPALACPAFFDTFYLIVTPVYASMYFPGAALMYVAGLWLHLPYEIAPLAVSGLCVAALYLVVAEVLDGMSGLLAALLLLSLGMFRIMSMLVMAQTPLLLLGLVMTWAWLRWRRHHGKGWLILLGFAAGWAAITRPADALCFAIAIGGAMALDLRASPRRLWLKTAAIVVAAAAPFLCMQLVLNHAVTGRWFYTPFAYYTDINYPGAFGFSHGPAVQHVSDVPEKQFFYDTVVKSKIENHRLDNIFSMTLLGQLQHVAARTVAAPLLWIILPLSLLSLWNRKFWAVWGVLPVYLIVLSGYAFSPVLPHYTIVVMPAVIFLCLAPIRFLTDAFPKRRAMIRTFLGVGIATMAMTEMPQWNWVIHDQYYTTPELLQIDARIARGVSPPAVVLFHFNRNSLIAGRYMNDDPNQEPVFNSDVAWPDDAPIIRARDLNADVSSTGKIGDRNLPLYEYYLRHDPGRVFYLYDRAGGSGEPKRLGTAAEMVSAATEGSRS